MTLKVKTSRFGELEIDDDKVIKMPDGMLGFNEERFIILNPENGGPFCWLQAVDNPSLAFVIIDPTQHSPGYRVNLTREEYDKLQLGPKSEVVLLSVVTMASEPRHITMNLQGPIVVNPDRMIAKQVVLEGNFSVRQPLFPAIEPTRKEATPTARTVRPVSRISNLGSGMKLPLASNM